MKYKSTRDSSSKEYTFEQALFSGYAPDGGLFVPSSLPSVTADDLVKWSTLSYPELVYVVLVSRSISEYMLYIVLYYVSYTNTNTFTKIYILRCIHMLNSVCSYQLPKLVTYI